jgi:hypothetical protein
VILTCSTCGHRGEDGKDYNHDCYWVFRERGQRAHDEAQSAASTPPEEATKQSASSESVCGLTLGRKGKR